MRAKKRLCQRRFASELLEPRRLLTGVVISEFMADNDDSFLDGDGLSSDWIEIANQSTTSQNLQGWSLTDSADAPRQWMFPDVTLAPNELLVVFASNQAASDYVDASGYLHTNFSLDADGDYLGLVDANGTVVSEYDGQDGEFGAQQEDVSFGLGRRDTEFSYVRPTDASRFWVPDGNLILDEWRGGGPFDDATWQEATAAIGFDSAAVATPSPFLGWDSTFPLDGNSWAPSQGGSRTWSFNSPPEQISLEGAVDQPGLLASHQFDGSQAATTASFQGIGENGSAAFEIWFRPESLTAGDQVLWETGGVNGASLTINDATLRFGTSNTGENPTSRSISYEMTADDIDRFVHVVGVVDQLAQQTRMYVNGELIPGTVDSATAFWSGTNNSGLGGEAGNATGGFASGSERGHGRFRGQLAVFHYYQTALTDAEVVALYESVSNPDFSQWIQTDVEQAMLGNSSSGLLRIPFAYDASDDLDSLSLSLRYDDGYVAYLNGSLISEANVPAPLAIDSAAFAPRDDFLAADVTALDVSAGIPLLVQGENILAIQALNASVDAESFLLTAELVGAHFGETEELYFLEPTPGLPNGNGVRGFVGDTKFSVDRGFFAEPFDLLITSDTEEAQIYFTVDGSSPTPDSGTLVDGPIHVSTTTTIRAAAYLDSYAPSNADTQTYLFLADVVDQSNTPAGYPTNWAGVPADYEMDPDVVGVNNLFEDVYRDTIVDDLYSLPSVSLVTEIDNLFGLNGIYVNPGNSGDAWERPVSIEFLANGANEESYQLDAGVRIQGGSSRSIHYPKHSLRLEFRDEYGTNRHEEAVFADQPYGESAQDSFDELVLRAAFNNSWTHWHYYQTPRGQYVRDQFVRDLQFELGHTSTHGRYVHLYLNGLYWGIYNLGERPAAPFQADYFGGSREDWDVLNSGVPIDGDNQAWGDLFAAVNSDLTDSANYEQVEAMLDVDHFIDYMLINYYVGNADWDGHNWISARQRVPGGQFRFFTWDSEFAAALPPSNTAVDEDAEQQILGFDRTGLNGNNRPTRIFHQLIQNSDFQIRFLDRVSEVFTGDGPLTPQRAIDLWMRRADQVDRAVVAESARWGDYRRDVHSNNWPQENFDLYHRDEHYIAQQEFVTGEYLPQRTDIVLGQFRNRGWISDLAAPVISHMSGTVEMGTEVQITGSGAIYYTLDGSDPREVGGSISPQATLYTGPIVVEQGIDLVARSLDNGSWSPKASALLLAITPASAANLAVTELNYHPYAPTPVELQVDPLWIAEDFEFVEVQNISDALIDLSGVQFVNGVEFAAGSGASFQLAPGSRGLFVANHTAFEQRYGTELNIFGEYTGRLRNRGEQLELQGFDGTSIFDFRFDDDGEWPTRADGRGSSLERLDTAVMAGNGANWEDSLAYGGSPGAGAERRIDVVVNEVAANPIGTPDWIELYNASDADVDVSGWYLSDSWDDYRKFQIPAGTVLESNGYLVINESQFNGADAAIPFQLDAHRSEDVWLLEANTTDHLTRFADHVGFQATIPGESWGRLPDGDTSSWGPLVAPSPGLPNDARRLGPVYISEVMYNAPAWLGAEASLEYVEIHNPEATVVDLSGWRLDGGIEYQFSSEFQLPANSRVAVLSFDPADVTETERLAEFVGAYNLPDDLLLVGPYTGQLANGGEELLLLRAGMLLPEAPAVVPFYREDYVVFDDVAPWPAEADGQGGSLHRSIPLQPGELPASWFVDQATPAYDQQQPPVVQSVELNLETIDPPDLDGVRAPTSWSQQRSLLAELVVTFNEPVRLTAADVLVTSLGLEPGVDQPVEIALAAENIIHLGGRLKLDLRDVEIPDGVLELELANSVQDALATQLDGDHDGVGGDAFVTRGDAGNRLYKVVGDFNADGGVSVFDFATFAYWFGSSIDVAPAYADLNGDLGVTIFDMPIFAANFGRAVVLPAARSLPAVQQQEPLESRLEEQQTLRARLVDELFRWVEMRGAKGTAERFAQF